ncbi:NAD(P)-binding domain-containing protein [Paenibacillus tundrae]
MILEAGGEAVGAWPQYYDNLKLFSPTKYSSLPGLSINSPGDQYPHRDEVIQYLKDYASHFDLPLVYNNLVDQVSIESGVFTVTTSSGEKYVALNLISATGSFSRPYTPSIPKHERFEGKSYISRRIEHRLLFIINRSLL